jgi:hypothetical protein
MNDSQLEKLRSAWRETPAFDGAPLDEAAIDALLKQQSRDVTRQFRVALLMDIALKAVIAVALAIVLWLHRQHAGLTALNTMVLLATLLCIGFERAALKAIPGGAVAGGNVRTGLQTMLGYYRERFKRALYVIGLSGPLVFYTGVVHYLWYRYGGLRPFDGTDLAVFGIGLAIAYLLSVGAQQTQFRQYVNGIKDCLREIEENGTESATNPAETLRARRLRHRLVWSLVLLAGVLLLAWLVLSY